MSRWGKDEGANAVEFALVLPILLVLIFGLMWGGIAFEQNLAITHASRESARFGATIDVTSSGAVDATKLDQIRDRALAAAVGRLDDLGGSVNAYVCVAYVEDHGGGGGANHTTQRTNGGTRTGAAPSAVTNSCYDDGIPADEPRIQVYVERDALLDLIFYGGTIRLDSSAVAYYEHEELGP